MRVEKSDGGSSRTAPNVKVPRPRASLRAPPPLPPPWPNPRYGNSSRASRAAEADGLCTGRRPTGAIHRKRVHSPRQEREAIAVMLMGFSPYPPPPPHPLPPPTWQHPPPSPPYHPPACRFCGRGCGTRSSTSGMSPLLPDAHLAGAAQPDGAVLPAARLRMRRLLPGAARGVRFAGRASSPSTRTSPPTPTVGWSMRGATRRQ